MKKIIKNNVLCLILIYLGFSAVAQKQTKVESDNKTYLYLLVDNPPRFRGGIKSLQSFLLRNLKQPEPNLDVQGTVLLSFTVLKTGRIDNVFVEKSLSKSFDEEAIKLISIMPKWIPGELNGKRVNVKVYFPIDFSYHNK